MPKEVSQPNKEAFTLTELLACQPEPRRRQAKAAFTLAELLVVIAIIGIMFAIALPTLSNLTSQTKLEAAANAVHSVAKMARQYAVANKQPTYLVFNDTATDPQTAYRSYAVFTINIHTNPVSPSAGYYIKDWTPLPPGIVFNPDAGTENDNVFTPSAQPWVGGFNRNRQLRIGPDVFTVLGFKPTGSHGRSYDNDIYLSEGFFENGSLTLLSDQTVRIHIDGFGRSRIETVILNGETVEEIAR